MTTPEQEGIAKGSVVFRMGDKKYQFELSVPASRVPRSAMLPVFRDLMNLSIAQGVAKAAVEGRSVSCRAGCGACCRQLVPVSPVEARQIRDLVMAMPEDRRAAVMERFADAKRRLEEAGLHAKLLEPDELTPEERRELGWNYFLLGIPCPFLVEESCSIHPDRPLICREYLVSSPAANCVHPTKETIERVGLPMELARVLGRFRDGEPNETTWVALSVAMDWAESHPDPEPDRTGPEWVGLLLGMIGKKPAGDGLGSTIGGD